MGDRNSEVMTDAFLRGQEGAASCSASHMLLLLSLVLAVWLSSCSEGLGALSPGGACPGLLCVQVKGGLEESSVLSP